MKYVQMSFYILLITLAVVLIPSFALISSSQSNNSLSNNSLSGNSEDNSPSFDNETSFASLSRSLAEKNQSSEEPIPPPPPSEDAAIQNSNN
jgi:hypothetical protein